MNDLKQDVENPATTGISIGAKVYTVCEEYSVYLGYRVIEKTVIGIGRDGGFFTALEGCSESCPIAVFTPQSEIGKTAFLEEKDAWKSIADRTCGPGYVSCTNYECPYYEEGIYCQASIGCGGFEGAMED